MMSFTSLSLAVLYTFSNVSVLKILSTGYQNRNKLITDLCGIFCTSLSKRTNISKQLKAQVIESEVF